MVNLKTQKIGELLLSLSLSLSLDLCQNFVHNFFDDNISNLVCIIANFRVKCKV
jgi:hypothetical protein